MSTVMLQGKPVHTIGEPPKAGAQAPEFHLSKSDLSEAKLSTYKGKRKVLNVFPSVDTSTCATSVRKFNEKAASLRNTVVINISADLPFAQARFCAAEGIANCETFSSFRSTFGKDYKLQLADSPLSGLLARAVMVLDEHDKVLYSELVSEISHEPNYDKALAALG